jgi:hypothetical protein
MQLIRTRVLNSSIRKALEKASIANFGPTYAPAVILTFVPKTLEVLIQIPVIDGLKMF